MIRHAPRYDHSEHIAPHPLTSCPSLLFITFPQNNLTNASRFLPSLSRFLHAITGEQSASPPLPGFSSVVSFHSLHHRSPIPSDHDFSCLSLYCSRHLIPYLFSSSKNCANNTPSRKKGSLFPRRQRSHQLLRQNRKSLFAHQY